jgi:hypothetical protein
LELCKISILLCRQIIGKCSQVCDEKGCTFYVCLRDVESHERLLKRNTRLLVWLSKSDEFDHRLDLLSTSNS